MYKQRKWLETELHFEKKCLRYRLGWLGGASEIIDCQTLLKTRTDVKLSTSEDELHSLCSMVMIYFQI